MKLTGHKAEAVYRRYAIVSEADLTTAVQKLAVLHAATGSGSRSVILISPATGYCFLGCAELWDRA
jgi:hypothetical protein